MALSNGSIPTTSDPDNPTIHLAAFVCTNIKGTRFTMSNFINAFENLFRSCSAGQPNVSHTVVVHNLKVGYPLLLDLGGNMAISID